MFENWPKKQWEFNILGIYNYNEHGVYDHYFNHIKESYDNTEGDLLEAGVFRGSKLLAAAMLLKELGSKKKCMGMTHS